MPKLPPVIERKPTEANARAVIHAARRGERLWLEGDEGIVQPMAEPSTTPFLDMARAEEREWRESVRRSAEMNGQRVEFVGNTMVVVSGRPGRVQVDVEGGE